MKYARRTHNVQSSDTRELLNKIGFDNMISFAGGLPAVEGFPVMELHDVMQSFIPKYGEKAMQYSATEGIRPLRDYVANRLNHIHGKSLDRDNILITSGSQQALDILGKVFLDQGDKVLVEEPTYFSALNVFRSYEVAINGCETDEAGVVLPEEWHHEKLKFAYYIPDFQNPSGRQWTKERKMAILNKHKETGIPLIEDCPYSEINFQDEKQVSMLSMDTEGLVIHLGSFSKVFCPGLRVGYIVGDKDLIAKCALMKQSMDLHTSTMTQYLLLAYLEKYLLEDNINKVKGLYKHKRDVMIEAVSSEFGEIASYVVPNGGMFLWVTLPSHINTRKLYYKALEEGVMFIAGDAFYTDGRKSSGLRLNYTNMSDEQIKKGIIKLRSLLIPD